MNHLLLKAFDPRFFAHVYELSASVFFAQRTKTHTLLETVL
jgi:hypothetical protein